VVVIGVKQNPVLGVGRADDESCGWSSVQMYRRYLDMNEDDIAAAFGTGESSQIDKRLDKKNRLARHK
jgi:hypothetical protein